MTEENQGPDELQGLNHELLQALRINGGRKTSIISLLEQNANPDTLGILGRTALHFAAINGNVDAVESLMKYNADLNIQEQSGYTPLYLACLKRHFQVIKLLVSKGADPNICDTSYSESPLQQLIYYINSNTASHEEKMEIRKSVELLLNAGARMDGDNIGAIKDEKLCDLLGVGYDNDVETTQEN